MAPLVKKVSDPWIRRYGPPLNTAYQSGHGTKWIANPSTLINLRLCRLLITQKKTARNLEYIYAHLWEYVLIVEV